MDGVKRKLADIMMEQEEGKGGAVEHQEHTKVVRVKMEPPEDDYEDEELYL